MNEHLLAVANIDYMFENALYGWGRGDNRRSDAVGKVHRFFVPMKTAAGLKL